MWDHARARPGESPEGSIEGLRQAEPGPSDYVGPVSMNHGKNSPQALRFAERRKREDEAPRLRDQVPHLTSLRLEIEDRCDVGGTAHTRPVLLSRAPALFLIQCGDPRC